MPTPTIPEFEPQQFAIGETLIWRKRFRDYPPSDGWALTYYFRGPTKFDAAAVTDSEDSTKFKITVAASSTANCIAGAYYWQAWVDKSGEKHLLDEGQTVCKAGLSALEGNYDGRSVAKKIVAGIDDMMLGKTSLDQLSYEIASTLGNRKLV